MRSLRGAATQVPECTAGPVESTGPAVCLRAMLRSPCAAHQNAPVPFGVPSPVGPSKPVVPVQRYEPPQLPLLPDVTSLSELACEYGYEP